MTRNPALKLESFGLQAAFYTLTAAGNELAPSSRHHRRAASQLHAAARVARQLHRLTGEQRWSDTSREQFKMARRLRSAPVVARSFGGF